MLVWIKIRASVLLNYGPGFQDVKIPKTFLDLLPIEVPYIMIPNPPSEIVVLPFFVATNFTKLQNILV